MTLLCNECSCAVNSILDLRFLFHEHTDFKVERVQTFFSLFFHVGDGAFRTFIIPALNVEDDPFVQTPEGYYLSHNFPNPFNAQTRLRFGLPEPGEVSITVWDMHGRRVDVIERSVYQSGHFETVWHAGSQPSGIYLVRMQTDGFIATRKVLLVR